MALAKFIVMSILSESYCGWYYPSQMTWLFRYPMLYTYFVVLVRLVPLLVVLLTSQGHRC